METSALVDVLAGAAPDPALVELPEAMARELGGLVEAAQRATGGEQR